MLLLIIFAIGFCKCMLMGRDFIDFMCFTMKPCPMLVSGGRDGKVSIWNPNDLRMVASITHTGKNEVYMRELSQSMDTAQKALVQKAADRRFRVDQKVMLMMQTVLKIMIFVTTVTMVMGMMTMISMMMRQ